MSEQTSEPEGKKHDRDIDWAYVNEQHRIWREEHKDEKPVWWSI